MTEYPSPHTTATVPPPPPPRVSVRLPLGKPRYAYILLGLNIAVWLAVTAVGFSRGYGLNGSQTTATLLDFGAQMNALVAQGELWRLLTSMFLHVGLLHLLFNSYALYILGRDIESLFGSPRFLVTYLLSGLGGSVVFYLLGDNVPSAGASGAIFGLIGAEIAFFYVHRQKFGAHGRQRLLNLLFVAGFNLFIGATVPGINNLAHVGGLVTGTVLGWLLVPYYVQPPMVILGVDNSITLEDHNSLRRRLPAVALVILILALMAAAATVRWSNSVELALDRALEMVDGGQYQAAADILRPLAEDEPDDGTLLFYLGVVEANLGNIDAARQAWEQSMVAEPDVASTHWNLAMVYADLGRRSDALDQLRQFVQLADSEAEKAKAEALIQEWSR